MDSRPCEEVMMSGDSMDVPPRNVPMAALLSTDGAVKA